LVAAVCRFRDFHRQENTLEITESSGSEAMLGRADGQRTAELQPIEPHGFMVDLANLEPEGPPSGSVRRWVSTNRAIRPSGVL
jgi:hypothetical protein